MSSSDPTNGAIAAITAVSPVQPAAAGGTPAPSKAPPSPKAAAPQDTVAISSSSSTQSVASQVLLLTDEGQSAQAIAALLGITVAAVKSYLG
jgi:hypothetical protein